MGLLKPNNYSEEEMRISRKLSAISNPARMRMIKMMREKPATISEIQKEINLSQSSVKEHMRMLKHAGLIKAEYTLHFLTFEVEEKEMREIIPFCCALKTRKTKKPSRI